MRAIVLTVHKSKQEKWRLWLAILKRKQAYSTLFSGHDPIKAARAVRAAPNGAMTGESCQPCNLTRLNKLWFYFKVSRDAYFFSTFLCIFYFHVFSARCTKFNYFCFYFLGDFCPSLGSLAIKYHRTLHLPLIRVTPFKRIGRLDSLRIFF